MSLVANFLEGSSTLSFSFFNCDPSAKCGKLGNFFGKEGEWGLRNWEYQRLDSIAIHKSRVRFQRQQQNFSPIVRPKNFEIGLLQIEKCRCIDFYWCICRLVDEKNRMLKNIVIVSNIGQYQWVLSIGNRIFRILEFHRYVNEIQPLQPLLLRPFTDL